MERSPARDVTGSTPVHAAATGAVPPDLAETVERYGDGLGDYCRMWVGDAPAAVVAETVRAALLLVRERREPSRNRGEGRALLYAAARACCLIRLTRPVEGAASIAGAPPRTREADAAEPILAGLQALDRRQREVLELACRHGLDLAEIAAVTGLSAERAGALLTEAQDVYEAWVNVVMLTRASRAKCAEGADLAADWAAHPVRNARTRLRAHVTACATCSAPASLTVDAMALLGRIPFTPLTQEQRALILDPSLPPPVRIAWGADGFPVQPDRERPAAPPLLQQAPVLSAGLEANRTIGFWDPDTPDVPIDDPTPASGADAPSHDDASPRRNVFRRGGAASGDLRRTADRWPPFASASRETAPRESAPRESAPRGSEPGEAAPREATPRETAPRTATPRGSEPWETAPLEAAPRGSAPQGSEPGEAAPREAALRGSGSPWSGRLGRDGSLPGGSDGFEELGPRTGTPHDAAADGSTPGFGTFHDRAPRRVRPYDDGFASDPQDLDPDLYGHPGEKRRRSGKALAATAGVVLIGGLAWAVFGPSERAVTLDVANEKPASTGPEPPTPIPAPPEASARAAAPGGAPSGSAAGETPLDPTGTADPGVEVTPDATPTDAGVGDGASGGFGVNPDDGAASGSRRTPDAGAGSGAGGSDSGGAGAGATAGATRTPNPGATRTPDAGARGSGGSGSRSGIGGTGAGASPKPSGVASATPGGTGRRDPEPLPSIVPGTKPSAGAKASPSGAPVPSHRPSPSATGRRAAVAPVRLIVTEGTGGDRQSEIILLRAVNGTIAWRAAISTPLLQLSSSRGVVGPNRRDGFQIRLTPLRTLAAQGRSTVNHLYANCGKTRTAVLRIAWTGVNQAGVRTQDVIPIRVTFNRPCP
ncbi:sigma factor-like helix-turn-helix DNA-binding protein [Thermopolyspora sp. NPDC052614]|uniref:sigma factor-like helix-turn-helix DNA-binding protein n=1 Tax=Thermopolyspora sp. NPDC052614 TaxID=3155682 RepID=UPI0034215CC5